MATSGLFLGTRDEIRVIPYEQRALEAVAAGYRRHGGVTDVTPEPFIVADKPVLSMARRQRGDDAVAAVAATWARLGLRFPSLACA